MLRHTFATISALLLLGCANNPIDEGAAVPEMPVSHSEESSVIPGVFRVKLAVQAGELRTGDFTRGEGSGCEAFDAAATRAGVNRVKRLFPDSDRFRERHRRAGLDRWYDVYFPADMSVSEAMSRFGKPSEIEVVEPVYRMVPTDMETSYGAEKLLSFTVPQFNDPLLSNQWCYRNEGSYQDHIPGADLNVIPAWAAATGSSDVIVAVFDGGIEYTHPDLAANMWSDEQGHCGYNFCRDRWEVDPSPHGTRVAGMIGAVNNNGIGVCGIAGGDGTPDSGAKMISCQVFDSGEGAHGADMLVMYVWAADHGAVISQNSWSYVGLSDLGQSGKDAIDYFVEYAGCDADGNQIGPMKGGVVIFAAGNDSTDVKQFPAAYEPVISVGSLRPDYKKVASSNYGSWVDIFAMGGESGGPEGYNAPFTTDIDGGYIFASGTSMACPQVSGIAALAISYYSKQGPGFTSAELRELLINSGRLTEVLAHNPEYKATDFGTGLIDAEYVVFCKVAPDAPADLKAVFKEGKLDLSWTIAGDYLSRPLRDYDVYVSTTELSEGNLAQAVKYEAVCYGAILGNKGTYRIENLPPSDTYYVAVASRSKYGTPSALTFTSWRAGEEPDDPEPPTPTPPAAISEPTFYPNPFADRLNVRLSVDKATCRLKLYDRAGRLALDTEVTVADYTGAVATQFLSPGNYRAVLDYESQTFERTVVKR